MARGSNHRDGCGQVRAEHGVAEELSELMGAADEVDELGDADAVGGALHTLLSL